MATASDTNNDKTPTPDPAENNAFFPSKFSLNKFTSAKSDLDGDHYDNAYKGGRWKILMIATDERYLLMQNGTMFSTGNHPVEMLLPIHHLNKAGFEFDVATISGNPVKLELWAMPTADEAVGGTYEKYLPKLKSPMKLSEVIEKNLGKDSDYIGVFIPGGHGALVGVPHSEEVKTVLKWAMKNDKYIISLCHGPASFLSAAMDESKDDFIFNGYKICAFPDSIDKQTPDIGYMPGALPWFIGEKLKAVGLEILNDDITGKVHQDRKVITGDSPFASNNLGKAAAKALLEEFGS